MTDSPTPGTPAWLRTTNDRLALSLLLDNGALTRNRLGELSGLSKPTAAQMVSRLEEAGLIYEAGELSAGRGPNAVTYDLRLDRAVAVAIDIDEIVIRSTVVDARGTERPIVETPISEPGERTAIQDVRTALESACHAASLPVSAVTTVGIGVQAATDPAADRLRFTDAMAGWPRANVRGQLENELGVRVIIENDVNLAAVAERNVGSASDVSSFGLVWLGEGLGLSIDLGGTIHHGAFGAAGEIGYLPIPQGAANLAPEANDLQQFIGGPAIARLVSAEVGLDLDYWEALDHIVSNAADAELIGRLAARIAVAIIPVLAILDPEIVVLGGPTGSAGGDVLAEAVMAHIAETPTWSPTIRATHSPANSVLVGARTVLVGELRSALLHLSSDDDAPSHRTERLHP